MRKTSVVIGTGGPIIDSHDSKETLRMSVWDARSPFRLKPKVPAFVRDSRYILYADELLSSAYHELALSLAGKYLERLQLHKKEVRFK